jgi:response regulator of citrate/malate metabolism
MSLDILLIDQMDVDQVINQDLVNQKSNIRFHVTRVHLLRHALEVLMTKNFDCILLNPFLLDSKGLSTVDAILGTKCGCPVIVLTRFSLPRGQLRQTFLRRGVASCVNVKYLSNQQGLASTIIRVVESRDIRNNIHSSRA